MDNVNGRFSVLSMVTDIFKPAAELIDNLHTSDEEKLIQKTRLVELQAAAVDSALQYNQSIFEGQARIVSAEASSDRWLAANWRPITMLTFVTLVVAKFLGFEADGMTASDYDHLWSLIELGLGGYVVGRSVEKAVKTWKDNK